MSNIRLAAFDVDGTLLRGENICGCIGRHIGRSTEMEAFERLRSREEMTTGRETMLEWYLPFSKARLIEHLADLRLAPGVTQGFARLKAAGVKIALVSITWQFAVEWLAAELGADYAVGTGWREDNTLSHFWPEDKAIYLNSLLAELKLEQGALAAVGDSHGDIPMLNLASRSYFVGKALPQELLHAEHWPHADIEEIVLDMLARG
ncbi:HAD family hydrolase [Pararhizobium polonicum]|uniref:HAD family hydrolase n=1 Tax=Pararhizobium polonicum TaxID=1612624 RepID=UPI00083B3A2B|nr:HAD-IB family phosphatase [Pararhizobium polonicum]